MNGKPRRKKRRYDNCRLCGEELHLHAKLGFCNLDCKHTFTTNNPPIPYKARGKILEFTQASAHAKVSGDDCLKIINKWQSFYDGTKFLRNPGATGPSQESNILTWWVHWCQFGVVTDLDEAVARQWFTQFS